MPTVQQIGTAVQKCLGLAEKYKCRSIAFPAIGTGILYTLYTERVFFIYTVHLTHHFTKMLTYTLNVPLDTYEYDQPV